MRRWLDFPFCCTAAETHTYSFSLSLAHTNTLLLHGHCGPSDGLFTSYFQSFRPQDSSSAYIISALSFFFNFWVWCKVFNPGSWYNLLCISITKDFPNNFSVYITISYGTSYVCWGHPRGWKFKFLSNMMWTWCELNSVWIGADNGKKRKMEI